MIFRHFAKLRRSIRSNLKKIQGKLQRTARNTTFILYAFLNCHRDWRYTHSCYRRVTLRQGEFKGGANPTLGGNSRSYLRRNAHFVTSEKGKNPYFLGDDFISKENFALKLSSNQRCKSLKREIAAVCSMNHEYYGKYVYTGCFAWSLGVKIILSSWPIQALI